MGSAVRQTCPMTTRPIQIPCKPLWNRTQISLVRRHSLKTLGHSEFLFTLFESSFSLTQVLTLYAGLSVIKQVVKIKCDRKVPAR
jgi:hypothetical protein